MATLPAGAVPLVIAGLNCGSYIHDPDGVLSIVYANPGFGSNANGTEFFATTYIDVLPCNVRTVGISKWEPPDICISHTLGGIDIALTDEDGERSVALYFYVMRQDVTGDLALMASRAGDYRMKCPPGWWPQRQLRFTSVWKLGRGLHWNGLGDFFQCVDNSEVMLTGAGDIFHYEILPPSMSKTDRDFLSLKQWVANDARWVTLHCTVSYGDGAGSGYVYASPVAERPFLVGQAQRPGDNAVYRMDCMPDSDGNIAWSTYPNKQTGYGGARLKLVLCGYRHSNPT